MIVERISASIRGLAARVYVFPSRFWNAIWPRRMREGLYMDNNYIVNIYAILSMV